MLEHLINYLAFAAPVMVYMIMFLFPFIKNIYPPSPSDLIVIIGGTYVATGKIAFLPTLLLTSLSSEIGFVLLFYIGWRTEKNFLTSGRFKFISVKSVSSAERWFAKHGFKVILVNRFVIGIRAVAAFFAGINKMDIRKTIIYSSVSSLLWHLLLLSLGFTFAANIKAVDEVLSVYGKGVLAIILTTVLVLLIRRRIMLKRVESN